MSVEDSWHTLDKATGKKVQTKRYGRGKRWRVRNRGARTVSFDKRSDADAHDTAVKGDLLKGVTPFDHGAGRVTFAEYSRKWLREHHYDPNSRRTVSQRLEALLIPTFGQMRMRDVQASTVISWLAELRDRRAARTGEPLAESTLAAVFVLLNSIMRAAVVDRVKPVNPCDGVPRPRPAGRRVVSVWEHSTVAELLAAVPDRLHAVPLLAATCGHRQGEALAVAVADINFLRNTVTVQHQVKRVGVALVLVAPKRGKVRTVPLPQVTKTALAAHLERYGTVSVRCRCCRTDNAVLFTQRGGLISAQDWGDEWNPAVRSAKLDPPLVPSPATGLHQLRHYFASMLIEGGASMKQVQQYMGHASIKITADVYGHLFEASHDRARSIIDSAFTPQTRSTSAVDSRR